MCLFEVTAEFVFPSGCPITLVAEPRFRGVDGLDVLGQRLPQREILAAIWADVHGWSLGGSRSRIVHLQSCCQPDMWYF